MPDAIGVNVLAVDDRNANLVALQAVLAPLDTTVVTARSGLEALELVRRLEFAVILLDVHMPEMDGIETARRVRRLEETQSTPVMFLTAYDRLEELVGRAHSLGAVDFLFKPLVPEILHWKLGVLIDLYRKNIEIRHHEQQRQRTPERAHDEQLADERSRFEAERLRREVELKTQLVAERERQFTTLQSVNEAIVAADESFAITLLNPAAEQLCGWTEQSAQGKPLLEVVRLLDGHTREPIGLPQARVDAIVVGRTGTERIVESSLAPIDGGNGAQGGVVLVLRDVTTQRQMEHDLQNTQRLQSLGLLAGGIAHDFNNLLGIIMSATSLAGNRLGEGHEAQSLLARIEEACSQATNLTRQLLTFARGGAPKLTIRETECVVRESVEFALRGSGTHCQFEFPPTLWATRLDVGQITQALSNVVINAREAMNDGGHLVVGASNLQVGDDDGLPVDPGPYVQIRVQDDGPGIARDAIQRVFDPYFTTKRTGTGLGLASAHSIVRRHSGLLRVESEPTRGTTFAMYLPALPDALVPEATITPRSAPYAASGRVLVMDDDRTLRDLVADCLIALGCRVERVGEGRQAIDAYVQAMQAGDPFLAVLLDLTVRGGLGGVETLEQLRSADPHVRAIACSGYADDPVMSNHQDYGFAAALNKPFRFAQLARTVRTVLGARRLANGGGTGAATTANVELRDATARRTRT